MKKLISLLMVLLMVFTSVVALAEATDDSSTLAPGAGAEATGSEAPAEDGAAAEGDAAESIETDKDNSISSLPLMTKGLIVTAGGLCGVFLVLILFFLMIKVMGKLMK